MDVISKNTCVYPCLGTCRDEFFGIAQTRLIPSFTPVGFKKVQAPRALFHKLRDAYDAGLEKLTARGDVSYDDEARSSISIFPGAAPPS